MNATAAKQTRRDIRRAMGPQALDLLGQQAEAVRALNRFAQYIDTRLVEVETGLEQHEVQLPRLRHDVDVLCHLKARPFLGRLRWLLMGR